MNHPAASCEVTHLRDFIEAIFEEYIPMRFKKTLTYKTAKSFSVPEKLESGWFLPTRLFQCAVERCGFSVGEIFTRQLTIQPVATGAIAEVTKRSKPSV